MRRTRLTFHDYVDDHDVYVLTIYNKTLQGDTKHTVHTLSKFSDIQLMFIK